MTTERLWLVGLGFRTERGRLVHHYYVIPHAGRGCSMWRSRTRRPQEGRWAR
jgi:hypothetical protein